MVDGLSKEKKLVSWRPPPPGSLKLNVDGGDERQTRSADIRVHCNCKWEVLFMFSRHVGGEEFQSSIGVGHFRSSSCLLSHFH